MKRIIYLVKKTYHGWDDDEEVDYELSLTKPEYYDYITLVVDRVEENGSLKDLFNE